MVRYVVVLYIFLLSVVATCTYAQSTKWNGFMDINSIYRDKDKVNSFNLGQLDIYITSDITDRISFLAENTFTVTNQASARYKTALERAIIKYEVDNYLNFLIGKHHTPVSYWNNTYHHGRVLQPTSTRPLLFDFSIFPLHSTGLIINGDYIGKNNFGYQVMIGNGIGNHDAPIDDDKYKSVSITTSAEPIKDFKVLLSAYFDKISKGAENYRDSMVKSSVNQTLFAVNLTYLPVGKNVEFLSELMYVRNDSDSTGTRNSKGGYVYGGYTFNKITPYYRFDYIRINENDPLYKVDNVNAHTIGIRYSFNHLSNIKLEFMRSESDVKGNGNSFALQFGIGF